MTQKAQMTQAELDDAIDHVAKRMTHVDDDVALAARIVGSLPERRRGWWWMAGPAFAGLAIVVLAVVLRTFNNGSTAVPRTENASVPLPSRDIGVVPVVPRAGSRTSTVEGPQNLRRTIVERPQNVRRTTVEPTSGADHERALPAIEAVAALSMDSLTPAAVPAEATLDIAPLEIADLALDPVQK